MRESWMDSGSIAFYEFYNTSSLNLETVSVRIFKRFFGEFWVGVWLKQEIIVSILEASGDTFWENHETKSTQEPRGGVCQNAKLDSVNNLWEFLRKF